MDKSHKAMDKVSNETKKLKGKSINNKNGKKKTKKRVGGGKNGSPAKMEVFSPMVNSGAERKES
jgi:hypothetical protein